MKELLLFPGFFSLILGQLELDPSPFLIHLDRHNIDQALRNTSKPWFILACRDFTPECEKVWPVWQRIGRQFGDQFNIAELGGLMNIQTLRRLSAGVAPSFFFSVDGVHFLDYYWPREYEDLVLFMREGYKRYPKHRYRTIQTLYPSTYFYQGGIKMLQMLQSRIDGLCNQLGLPAIPIMIKFGLLIGVVVSLAILLLYQIYLCIYEPQGRSEFKFKSKVD